ncbi:hypothetical protein Bcop_0702 [Bacteroides coprosuis DSM 18011]|uniref:NigD-like C-terminal beta sandwich domain-containing protein n=2 Tax=Bacteroides TaxID=816 RepID=F3ZSP5_9BACE|nr:hypothetical protein Bcop_0702 [Bacteroides coprosuis DSM 18011]
MKTMIKKIFLACLSVTMLVGFQSCNDDDGYSLGDFWISYATVVREGNTYSLKLDSGQKLWVGAGWINYNSVDGQRVVADYTILGDNYNGYDHIVKVNYLYEILTKNVEFVKSEEDDKKFGNDGIPSVNEMWVSNDYLNIKFTYRLPSEAKAHKVSLVENQLKESPDDSSIYLEFRYNTYNNNSSYVSNSMASFNLNTIDLSGKTGIKILWKNEKGEESTIDVPLKNIDNKKIDVESDKKANLE